MSLGITTYLALVLTRYVLNLILPALVSPHVSHILERLTIHLDSSTSTRK